MTDQPQPPAGQAKGPTPPVEAVVLPDVATEPHPTGHVPMPPAGDNSGSGQTSLEPVLPGTEDGSPPGALSPPPLGHNGPSGQGSAPRGS